MPSYNLKINNRLQFSSATSEDMSIWIANMVSSSSMLEDLVLEIDFDNGKFTTLDIAFTAFKLSEKLKKEWTADRILAKIEKLKGFTIGG